MIAILSCVENGQQNDTADITTDTSLAAGNIEQWTKPLDSSLKIGLDSMLWICHFLYLLM